MSYLRLVGLEDEANLPAHPAAPPGEAPKRVRDSMPVGPGGPASLDDYDERRIRDTTRKLQIACRHLIESGLMPTIRKVAEIMGSSATTLGRDPHRRNLLRYQRLADARGLGKVVVRPRRETCQGCMAKDRLIEKLQNDVSKVVRKAGALRRLVTWHRKTLSKALRELRTVTNPDLPRRPRRGSE